MYWEARQGACETHRSAKAHAWILADRSPCRPAHGTSRQI